MASVFNRDYKDLPKSKQTRNANAGPNASSTVDQSKTGSVRSRASGAKSGTGYPKGVYNPNSKKPGLTKQLAKGTAKGIGKGARFLGPWAAAVDATQSGVRTANQFSDYSDEEVQDRGGVLPALAEDFIDNMAFIPDATTDVAEGFGAGLGTLFNSDYDEQGNPLEGFGDRLGYAWDQGVNQFNESGAERAVRHQQGQPTAQMGGGEAQVAAGQMPATQVGNPAQSAFPESPGAAAVQDTGDRVSIRTDNGFGEISAAPGARQQIMEQAGGTPGGGTVSTVPSEAITGNPNVPDPRVVDAARAAIERGEDVDLDAIFNPGQQGGQQNSVRSRMQEIRKELARPGRGMNQSYSDALRESRRRKSLRSELEDLQEQDQFNQSLQLQRAKAQQSQANSDRNFAFKTGKFQTQQAQDQFESARDQFQAQAEKRFENDPEKQSAYTAKMLHQSYPDYYFNTPDGMATRRQMKQKLVDAVQDEKGIYDWARDIFDKERLTQADIENLSFKDFFPDKGENVLFEWMSDNDVFSKRTPDPETGELIGGNEYAYLDNFDSETRYLIGQLIAMDNPEAFNRSARNQVTANGAQ